MPDYDGEAPRYDETRGGQERAEAAADAISRLLTGVQGPVLDVAAGTGIVTAALADRGHDLVGVDLSAGMLAVAATRLPGRVAQGSALALPIAAASVGAVTMIWVLQLLDGPAVRAAVAEAARVLRRGGVFVCTVDKRAAHHGVEPTLNATDARETVTALAGAHGLRSAGEARFVGRGQQVRGVRAEPVYRLAAFRAGAPPVVNS